MRFYLPLQYSDNHLFHKFWLNYTDYLRNTYPEYTREFLDTILYNDHRAYLVECYRGDSLAWFIVFPEEAEAIAFKLKWS